MIRVETIGLPPQRFPDYRIVLLLAVFAAGKPLLGSVVHARNPLQRGQYGQTQRDLIRQWGWPGKTKTLALIVVVQEGHEILARFTVRRQDILLNSLAVLEDIGQVGWARAEPFQDPRQHKEQRIVEGRVHANDVAGGSGVAPDEERDRVLVVIHLAEREEVLFARAQRELTHGIAENPLELRRNEFQRIDAKAVDVEFRYHILIGSDQGSMSRLQPVLLDVRINPFKGIEIAVRMKPTGHGVAPLREEQVSAQLVRKDSRVQRRVRWRRSPLGVARSVRVAPAHDQSGLILPGRLRLFLAADHVLEHVARVVQHDIQDHVYAQAVSFIHEAAQFLFGQGGGGAKARFDGQEVLNAIAVIGMGIKLAILEHRREPQRPDPQVFEVGKFGLDPVESSALELAELGVERQIAGWRAGIVKTIHHQEVDTLIAPILRRREQCAPGGLRLIEHSLNLMVEDGGWHD